MVVTPIYFNIKSAWSQLRKIISNAGGIALPSERASSYFVLDIPDDLPREVPLKDADAVLLIMGSTTRGMFAGGEIFVHENYREAVSREWAKIIEARTLLLVAVENDVVSEYQTRMQRRARVDLHSRMGSATELLDWLLVDVPIRDILSFHTLSDIEPWLKIHLAIASATMPDKQILLPSTSATAPPENALRVFICHTAEDKPRVRALYRHLLAAGFAPWFDEADLLPGMDWEIEISRAIKSSHVAVVCLSQRSITKEGYVQREIKYALDKADEMPERSVFVIPVKLEECDVPGRLSRWQWVSIWDSAGIDRLVRALVQRALAVGAAVQPPPR